MATEAVYTDVIGVDSTAVKKVYFVPGDYSGYGNVYVELTNGSLAGYKNVPQNVFEGFRTADSAGRYYNQALKGRYYGANGDVNLVFVDDVKKVEAPEPVTADETFTVRWEYSVTGEVQITAADGKAAAQRFLDNLGRNADNYTITQVVRPEVEVPFE